MSLLSCFVDWMGLLTSGTVDVVHVPDVITILVVECGEVTVSDVSLVESQCTYYTAGVCVT